MEFDWDSILNKTQEERQEMLENHCYKEKKHDWRVRIVNDAIDLRGREVKTVNVYCFICNKSFGTCDVYNDGMTK